MATWYSQSSGLASTLARWNSAANGSGSTPAAITDLDDDVIEIQDDHVIDWDIDCSGWAIGIQGMLIRGDTDNDGNTGMLRIDSTTLAAGTYCVKVKAGFGITGTTVNGRRGKVLVNSDGVWANTGALANDRLAQFIFLNAGSGGCWNTDNLEVRMFCDEPTAGCPGVEYTQDSVNTTDDTITVVPWATGVDCHFFNGTEVRVKAVTSVPGGLSTGTSYYVINKSGNTFQLSTSRGGSAINLTDSGTGQVDYMQWLPGFVRTYKSLKTVSSINTSTNVITMTAPHGWSSGTCVQVRSSGTMPGGLRANVNYYTYAVSGADLKLVGNTNGVVIDITSSGTGTIEIYDGHTDTATAIVNVLDDVTGDSHWSTTSERNRAVLSNTIGGTDTQWVTLSNITASAITLSANVDSIQGPGAYLVLVNRNISSRSSYTTGLYHVNQSTTQYSGNVWNIELFNSIQQGYGYACTVGGTAVHTYGGTIHNIDYAITGLNGGATIWSTIARVNRGVSGGNNVVVNGNITGSSYPTYSSYGMVFQGNLFGGGGGISGYQIKSTGYVHGNTAGAGIDSAGTYSGIWAACTWGSYQINYGVLERLLVMNCNTGLYNGMHTLNAVVFQNNNTDIRSPDYLIGYGVTMNGLTPFQYYQRLQAREYATCIIYNMADGGTPQAGHIKSASSGGLLQTVTGGSIPASPPVTLNYCYKQTGEYTSGSNQSYNWVDIPLWGKGGVTLSLDIYEKCDSNPSTFLDGPVWALIDGAYEFGNPSGILDSVSAQSDGGNDTNWHTLSLSYTPAVDGPIILRARMKDTAKIVYWMFTATGGYGGGAAVPMALEA